MTTAITDDDIVQQDKASPAQDMLARANISLVKKLETEAPSRVRRTAFVYGSWTFSFVATVFLSLKGGDGTIAKAAVDGFTSYMMAVATMYIVGYSVDSADFINKARTMISNKMGDEQ